MLTNSIKNACSGVWCPPQVVIRAARQHFAPALNDMMAHLLSQFAANPRPAFLYTASILLTEFGAVAEAQPHLVQMLSRFSEVRKACM